MPGTGHDRSSPLTEREIVSSRVFATERERIFAAWTDPRRLARWWGPAGFTNTFADCEVRPGGRWLFVMHGPDGTDYRNESVFAEVVPPERIVVDHVSGPRFRLTATFAEHPAGTLLTWHMLFESADVCARVGAVVLPANEQNFDRLTAELASHHLGARPNDLANLT
jgi:uncharacterized protein YndB with AHSA1/START domain